MHKRILSAFMVIALLVLTVPPAALAAGTSQPASDEQFQGASPFQQAFQEVMAERAAQGLPVPSSVEYDRQVIEPVQAPMLRSFSGQPAQQSLKIISTTTVEFDNPEQAGYEDEWPALVVKSDPASDPGGIVQEQDYTDVYYETLQQELPGIWQTYEFGNEPRRHTITETYEITVPSEQYLTQAQMLATEMTTAEQVLMGFTYEGPNIDYTIEDSLEVCLFGLCTTVTEFKAGFELDWALGLRLPAEVDVAGPTQMSLGSSYMMSAALTPQDWSATEYSNTGVAGEYGNEFVMRLYGFAGVKAELFGQDLCPLVVGCYTEVNFDESTEFVTPFGPGASFPIPPAEVQIKEYDFSAFSFALGISLQPLLGSTKITADWTAVPNSDCSGSGEVTFSEPGVPVSFGPLKACNLGPSDEAEVQLSNFRYWFNQFQIALNAYLDFELFGFGVWHPTIEITKFDLSGLTAGLYLDSHQGCAWQDVTHPIVCGPAGPDNKLTLSVPVVDLDAPISTMSTLGLAGNHGWYRSDVQVTLAAEDNPLSCGTDVDQIEYGFDGTLWNTYAAPFMVTSEGLTTVHHRATDQAGNIEAANSDLLKIDKTPPLISGLALPAPNGYGWNKTDVEVYFSASDAVSGIALITPDQTLTHEAAGQSVIGTAEDIAGNSSAMTLDGINIDKTKPVIQITSPQAGTYPKTSIFTTTWIATDALSGIASQSGTLDGIPVQNGQMIQLLLLGAGPHTFEVQATDKADNANQSSMDFFITTDINGLIAAKEYVCELGWITKKGVCSSLDAKLNAARNAVDRVREETAVKQIQAFLNELNAQKGKAISQRAYDLLWADASYVIAELQK